MKWKELAVSLVLLLMMESLMNVFFVIVQRKVLRVAEVCVMIVKRWREEGHINQKIALLIWQVSWALKF